MTNIYGYSENSLIKEKLKEYAPKKKIYKIMHIDMNKSI